MRAVLALTLVLMLGTAAAAEGAVVGVRPAQSCYPPGDVPRIGGFGFTPFNFVDITRDGAPFGSLSTNRFGLFAGTFPAGLARGERRRTYTATDRINPALTASVRIRETALAVRIRPRSAAPGRRLRIRARGFTRGKRLYAHVRGKVDRKVRVGKLIGRCRKLRGRRRILPRNAPTGKYVVQFDTARRYRRDRAVRVRFAVEVFRRLRAGVAASQNWRRIP